ncbi:MAG: CaiB/BaiF CoA-transferase family protein [Sphingomicrobium sp.]
MSDRMSPPLDGLKVLEFAGLGPAPHCAMLLADMGADVVRIEREGAFGPSNPVIERGRSTVTLDLSDAGDHALALAAIEKSDVLIESFRPGVMEKLGLGPEVACARNPALIYGRLTGWGQEGPLAKTAGHDITYLAVTGALAALGKPGTPPPPPLNLVGDYGGGSLYLAVGILAALVERQQSGRGQVIDAAIVDGVTSMMSIFSGQEPKGSLPYARDRSVLGGAAPFYRCYACADGRFVALGAVEEKFWTAFLAGIGMTPAAFGPRFDPANWPAQSRQLEGVFMSRTAAEWGALYAGTDACLTPLVTLDEAPFHPQVSARQSYVEQDGRSQPAPAPRFSRTPGKIRPSNNEGRAAIERWAERP